MRPRKAERIARSLKHKGFKPEERDHTFYRFFVHGKRTDVRTKISHGARECSTSLLAQMARQVHLDSRELAGLLDCPLGKDDYVRILCSKGIIDPDEIPRQLTIEQTAVTKEKD